MDNQRLLADLNAIEIPRNELWELAAASAEHHRDNPDDKPDFFAGMSLIAGRVKKGEHLRAFAILSRMQALARFVQQDDTGGWALPELPDGAIPTMEAVFVAAAEHPMVELDGEFMFERESFLERVLTVADPETTA